MTPGLLLAVAGAGAVGSVARFLVGRAPSLQRSAIPWGTLLVNLLGAFAAGAAVGMAAHRPESSWLPIVTIGLLGGLTTFSTWMVESVELWRERGAGESILLLAGTLAAGLFLASLGLLVTGIPG